MDAEKRKRMIQIGMESKKRSDEFNKKWQNEIPVVDQNHSRIMADISIFIKNTLEKTKISQRLLAQTIGITETSISRLLNSNNQNPTIKTIAKIEEALNHIVILTPNTALRYVLTGKTSVAEGSTADQWLSSKIVKTNNQLDLTNNGSYYEYKPSYGTHLTTKSSQVITFIKPGSWKSKFDT